MGTNYEAHYIDKKRHNQAFYVEDALTFGKFTVTPGLRWDWNSTFGSHQTPRLVLRTYVQPPIDIQQFASPLAGFRKYSSDSQRLYDEPLLKVEGAAQGTLVRMAVLDAYDGTVWSAAGGVEGDPSAGFRRVGSTIPGAPTQLPKV